MQDLDWPFNPQPGLCHFIQSSPGIREKHSTNLRLIVLIHSTFFRERQWPLSGNVALLPVACLNFAYIPDGGVAIRDKSLRDAGQVLAMREGGRIFAVNSEGRGDLLSRQGCSSLI